MNEEEKKAIKKINKITEECEQICIERNEDTEIYTDEPVPYIEYRTILNLLETQSKQIDLNWLVCKYGLRVARHVDVPGTYLFYTDYFYIDFNTREINIEKSRYHEMNILYDLIKADLVEKIEE